MFLLKGHFFSRLINETAPIKTELSYFDHLMYFCEIPWLVPKTLKVESTLLNNPTWYGSYLDINIFRKRLDETFLVCHVSFHKKVNNKNVKIFYSLSIFCHLSTPICHKNDFPQCTSTSDTKTGTPTKRGAHIVLDVHLTSYILSHWTWQFTLTKTQLFYQSSSASALLLFTHMERNVICFGSTRNAL